MNAKFPETTEQRRAGMARFRAQMLKAHERCAQDNSLSEKERAHQRELIASIKAAQKRFGEIK